MLIDPDDVYVQNVRMSLGPRNNERVELRVPSIDVKLWRDAADEAGITLSDWIRRACFNALSSNRQLTLSVHDIAEKRGVSVDAFLSEAFERFEAERKAKPKRRHK